MQAAQKLAPLLSLLRRHLGLQVTLFMNPVLELSDLPLKSYYRYVVPQFIETDDGKLPCSACTDTSTCDISEWTTLLAWCTLVWVLSSSRGRWWVCREQRPSEAPGGGV